MKTKIVAILSLFGVAGCATPALDTRAIPQALSMQQLAIDQCSSRIRMKEFPNMQAMAGCMLAAKRQFASDIKLQQMDLFEAYAQRVMLATKDYDEGRIPLEELSARWQQADSDWSRNVVLIFQQEQIDEADRRAAALAFIASRPAGNVYQPARPSLNCTTFNTGRIANTTCN